MTFSLVSLDMAGTTFDDGNTVYEVLGESVSRAIGAEVPRQLVDKWTGTSKHEAIEGMLAALQSDADSNDVYAEFTKALVDRYRNDPPAPFAGVTEMFAQLHDEGVKVALQTGYSRPIAELLLEGRGGR
ncbi:HAD family hydrolase [Leucobacter denitrificans]|uniref:HAD family hydrolase n=1 Tax=Leucobacter denitrificans TaxID=683042 RepID=UPI001FE7E8C8|nr:HAD family hydrolase [Leucobacter denitrificans]